MSISCLRNLFRRRISVGTEFFEAVQEFEETGDIKGTEKQSDELKRNTDGFDLKEALSIFDTGDCGKSQQRERGQNPTAPGPPLPKTQPNLIHDPKNEEDTQKIDYRPGQSLKSSRGKEEIKSSDQAGIRHSNSVAVLEALKSA